MYSDGMGTVLLGLVIINIIWLLGLTFLVRKNIIFLNKLFPKAGSGLKEKLEEILEEIKDLDEFKRKNLSCIQKVALERYNPYHDTGGDQSFSVALLDGKGDGVVITSLHSRSGTRVFAKPVKNKQEEKFEFSREEEEVIKKAV